VQRILGARPDGASSMPPQAAAYDGTRPAHQGAEPQDATAQLSSGLPGHSRRLRHLPSPKRIGQFGDHPDQLAVKITRLLLVVMRPVRDRRHDQLPDQPHRAAPRRCRRNRAPRR
jgi:hypothetical protein